jgi:hypothetical protein
MEEWKFGPFAHCNDLIGHLSKKHSKTLPTPTLHRKLKEWSTKKNINLKQINA